MRPSSPSRRALADARIVVSKDEDFLYLANQRGDEGQFLRVCLGRRDNDLPTVSKSVSKHPLGAGILHWSTLAVSEEFA